jgi:predicted anti-sigma-YlaC factor YlaD
MPESENHITCQQLVEQVSDYLEHALATGDAELFEQHLAYCEGCSNYVDEMRRTIGIGGRLGADYVPAETLERLLGEFRQGRSS